MKALHLQQRATTAAAAQSDLSGDQEQSALSATAAVAAAAAAAHTSRFADVDLSVDPDADDDETLDDSITDADMVLLSQRIESEKKCFRSISEPALLSGSPYKRWHDRAVAYPLLSVVARKWLAVPASSAASERMFSSAGLTVNQKRNSLKPELVATLVFLKTARPSLEAQGVLYGRDSKCKQSTNK
jgi:hAT family C-terminal dimerisation region